MGLVLTGSLISAEEQPLDADLPRLGWRNLLRDHVVTVSSEQTLFPAESAHDGFTDTAWIGDDQESEWWIRVSDVGIETVDYVAVTVWRLGDVSIHVESSADGVAWSPVVSPMTGTDGDRVLFWLVDEQSANHWRVRFTGTSPPEVSDVSVGKTIVLEPGFQPGHDPAPLARDRNLLNNQTETGRHVGRSVISRGVRSSFQMALVDPDWVRQHWEPFVDHAEVGSFYLAWAPVSFPNEVAFLHVPDGRVKPPRVTHSTGQMQVELEVRGIT